MAVVNLDDPSDVAAWNRRAPAPAPTDADIIALADKTRTGEPGRDGYILPISFARAVLAKWCAPAAALPPELASTARPASIAAVEVAAPSGAAREPLTDEQIDEIHLANSDAYERGDVEYESHGFARAIEHHHGITAAKKGGQHAD